ncbi:MAG TPA: T9SS type A sorting domain-containing protein [Saprospiraceae bacterium]|nr:T9SS type A sorting domain-containing protein [Saprospiraceae bacterium]HMQ82853.1 T9SS type A sorting domain-containing protein [Saprospiraceae bacterium]
MKKLFTLWATAAVILGMAVQMNAQCTTWMAPSATTGWTDFNSTFGGAPCDDGSGCAFNEITTFQVWAHEAYSINNFLAGGTYAFSMCNGSGAGSWIPEFTIIAPSGAIDAFGAGDGDGCTITWTASESGAYLIVITEAGDCGGSGNVSTNNGFPAITCISNAPCDPLAGACGIGELATTGTTVVCNGGTFDVATNGLDTIPAAGGFGWIFDDSQGGTGGLAGGFTLTGSDPNSNFNSDLNGVLSFNGLPVLSGTWVLFGVIYENAGDPLNTVCATTTDSLIVEFVAADGPTAVTVVDNGDGSATATATGGMMPYTYDWSDGQTGMTATGLTAGVYSVVVTDANGCTVEGSVTIGPAGTPCEIWINPSTTTGWTDFNSTFGGAPCDDGTGCPFNEITTFQVWAHEAYSVNNFVAGGTYTFSMCNGAGAGSWVPEFTIIAPSGAVDAFGAGDGDGCSITWTCSESGTYLIVVTEAGDCGGSNNLATDNGFPALTCVSSPETECEPIEVECEIGALTSPSLQAVCPGGTFDMITDGTDIIPEGGGFGWQFDDSQGGTGALAGGFTLTGSDPNSTFNSDLNGVLSANGLPVMGGSWVIRGVVYADQSDVFGSICAQAADSSIVVFFDDAPMIESIVDNGNNSATVTVTGGTGPYSYLWSDGQTTATATGLASGNYSVVVTDANGCTVEGDVDVISSVGQIDNLASMFLGPNPSQGNLMLKLALNSPEAIQVEVRNLVGQQMELIQADKTSVFQYEFNLNNYADGVYLIRIVVGQDEITKRVVVSK